MRRKKVTAYRIYKLEGLILYSLFHTLSRDHVVDTLLKEKFNELSVDEMSNMDREDVVHSLFEQTFEYLNYQMALSNDLDRYYVFKEIASKYNIPLDDKKHISLKLNRTLVNDISKMSKEYDYVSDLFRDIIIAYINSLSDEVFQVLLYMFEIEANKERKELLNK